MALPNTTNDVTTRRLGTAISSLWAKIKNTFQTIGNKVTSWSSTPSDTKYPSEKLVKTALDAKATDSAVLHKAGLETASGQKWFEGGFCVFNSSHIGYGHFTLAGAGSGPAYNNWTEEQKDGAHFREWSLSFNTEVNFWGKIRITICTSYSSFNASGSLQKTINCAFNQSTVFNNTGYYNDLGINCEKEYRISDLIWNNTTSCWEIKIHSIKPTSNNGVPVLLIEFWTYSTANRDSALGIHWVSTSPSIVTDTKYYTKRSGNASTAPTSGGEWFNWADQPVFQSPYGYEIFDRSHTIPIENGGTGQTTANGAQYALLNPKNSELTSELSDNYAIMFANASASASSGVFAGWRKASAFWTYIKDKISSVLGLTETSYGGNAATATTATTAAGYTSGGAIDTALQGKQDSSNAVTFTKNTDIVVAGTTKDTYTYDQSTMVVRNGIVIGGTAAAAGLVTRGICGVTSPDSTTGACSKENLYVNYDGDNTYRSSRQVVLQAGTVGTHYGNNLYQYAAARGDAVKDYSDAHYVSKENGKGLSTNDYTTAEKNKLAGIAAGAEVNVQSDWNQATTTADDYIKNKPTLGTAAAKDVPTSGNASATQVVMGNDSRLTDSRTPASHTHGNIQNGGTLQTTDVTIASGDKLVVTDSSDSNKVARTSVSFDGSTTTKALTQKGTFETFLQSHQDISGKEDSSNKVSSWSSTTTDTHYPSEKLVKDSLDDKANKSEGVYYVVGTVPFNAYSASSTYTVWSSGAYTASNACIYSNYAYYCKTAISTPESWNSSHWTKIATVEWQGTISEVTALYAGLKIAFKSPCYGGSSSTTLNINNLGAKPVKYNTSALTTHLAPGVIVFLTYDGTNWVWADYNSNTTYNGMVTAYVNNAGDAAKNANSTNFKLTNGVTILLTNNVANTKAAALTLNVNSTGAKALYINGTISSATNYTIPIGTYFCHYKEVSGTGQWHLYTDGTFPASKMALDTPLDVSNGGTGLNTVTSNSFLVGNGTSALVEKTPAQVLTLIGGQAAMTEMTTQEVTDFIAELGDF